MSDTPRSGTQCACRFDDNDENIHTCDWHRDEFAKLKQQLAEAQRKINIVEELCAGDSRTIMGLKKQFAEARKAERAECVRLLRRHPDAMCSTAADWLERQP